MILKKNYKENLYGYNCDSYDIVVDGETVGSVGLFFNEGKAFSDIHINESHRRKGYALKAKQELFNKSGLKEIYSWVNKDNVASCKLQDKMGCKLLSSTDDKYLFVWRL